MDNIYCSLHLSVEMADILEFVLALIKIITIYTSLAKSSRMYCQDSILTSVSRNLNAKIHACQFFASNMNNNAGIDLFRVMSVPPLFR